ncbi:hypothetical protein EI94DRAFT_44915 [Lactarius quietus]|nr:hypothetical protein EI94DRAFT_44915 [Lactarius quietus]
MIRLYLVLTKYYSRLSAGFIVIQRRLPCLRIPPAVVNETRDLNLSSAGNSGAWGYTSLHRGDPSAAGRNLLENVLSYIDDGRFVFAFRLGRDFWSSSLTFGRLDPSIANQSESIASTHLSKISVCS